MDGPNKGTALRNIGVFLIVSLYNSQATSRVVSDLRDVTVMHLNWVVTF